jgi:hypothetical protein
VKQADISGTPNKRKYLKDEINALAKHRKSKNIRDLYKRINEFKETYQR